MVYLSLVLFYLACFAGDVVELEPVQAHTIPAAITCSGITDATTNYQTVCDALPGCTWIASGLTGGNACAQDKCLAFGDSSTMTPITGEVYQCDCSATAFPALGMDPQGNCGNWPNSGYPPSSGGAPRDYYCKRFGTAMLDECSYQYLKNGTCTAPYCILANYSTPEGGKVCKKITQCAVSKLTVNNVGNVIKLNTAAISDCLTERITLGDTTACNQNPKFYLKNNVCTEDTIYAEASDQENPTCTTGVLKQVKGVVSNAEATVSYCVHADNPVLNNCWNLVNQTSPTSPPGNQCPLNPKPDATLLTENTNLCTGDCFVQTISSYYYGYTKICVNNESAGGRSSILVVPSLIALLLLAFFL